MTTFLFTQADGTSLSTMDAKWAGNAANFVTLSKTLTVTARNVIYNAWYANGQGALQNVSLSYSPFNTPNVGEIIYPTLQTNATQAGYLCRVQTTGRVDAYRNGSLFGYFTNLQGVFDPNVNAFTLTMSLLTGGILVAYINGTEAGRVTDSTPLTGGFPGMSSDYAYDVITYIGGNLAWSDATTIAFPAPNAPTNLVASTTNANPYQATLTWTDNSSDETGFTVQVQTPSGTGSWVNATLATANPTAANVTSATVTGLTAATSYAFRVAANGSGPSSAYVVSNAITTGAAIVAPAAPTNVVAGTVTEQSFVVTWTDNSSNEDYFKVEIEHPSGTGNWVTASGGTNPTAPNTTSFTVTGLAGGTQYRARVTAANLGGSNSALSNAITTTVITIPNAPTNIFVSQVDDTSGLVTWTDNSTNETSFKVEVQTPSGTGSWVNATGATNPTAANATSFTLGNLTANTSYAVRVSSGNIAGYSTPVVSSAFTTKTTPTPYTFTFNQADGTLLSAIDSRFQGDAGSLAVKTAGLGPTQRNTLYNVWFAAKQGVVQKSLLTLHGTATSYSADSMPTVMVNSTQAGYSAGFDSGRPAIYRNGSLIALGTATTLPTATYTLSLEIDTSANTLNMKLNGTSVCTATDSTPLTGGYPGISTSYAGDVTLAGGIISWTDGKSGALTAPSVPVNVAVNAIGSTVATANWLIGDTNSTSFIVQYSVTGSGTWVNATGGTNPTAGTATSFNLSQLAANTSYQVRVAAANAVGQSAWVTSSSFTTAQLGLVTPFITMYPF